LRLAIRLRDSFFLKVCLSFRILRAGILYILDIFFILDLSGLLPFVPFLPPFQLFPPFLFFREYPPVCAGNGNVCAPVGTVVSENQAE
jgi:hypothetical protein